MRNKVSILKGARNVVVKDSSIVVNADTCKPVPAVNLDRLIQEVAPNAILNVGGRADEVRCYPGTREEVIGKIEKWIDDEGVRTSRLIWLSGPAGAGKSAISQTIAERCRERGLRAANFFFFRADETRNHALPLVATLVYQLRRFYPALDALLTDCMAADPLICKGSIEDQFSHLLSYPIQTAQQSSPIQHPIILIIDGLDECDNKTNQELILAALQALAYAEHSSFLVMVASRAEPQLVMSFNKIGNSAESIFLDDKYRPEEDIRRFVVAKFDEIKKTHHLAHTLSGDWPAESDIKAITEKSSGQFIYAATVMRFIQHSSESPYLTLIEIHSMKPSASHNPLAPLDAVYSYIFSKARDLQAVKRILGTQILPLDSVLVDRRDILQLVGYGVIETQSLFADLAAIIKVIPDSPRLLSFYHASLNDYLADQSRSGIYHVDSEEVAAELSSICLANFYDSRSLNFTIALLHSVTKATATLSESLLTASKRSFDTSLGFVDNLYWLLTIIDRLYCKRDRAMFKTMLHSWVHFAYMYNTLMAKNTSTRKLSASATWYFHWYRGIEGAKFTLRIHKSRKWED